MFDSQSGLTMDDVICLISQQIVTWAVMCDSAAVTYTAMLKNYPCIYHRANLQQLKDATAGAKNNF